MSDLPTLAAHIQDIRETLQQERTNFLDPFWYNALITRVEHVQSLIEQMRKPPALAPPKHEPEPIIVAAKKPRPRAQKGH